MAKEYTKEGYDEMIERLFQRFPSFQKVGASAYKPGLDNMLMFDMLAGHPHRKYKTIHVAGTNGKGSVSSMLASLSAASGLRTGLYTSPHILDFRERMRIVDSDGTMTLISEQEVWNFVMKWQDTFDHLKLSFFEITTMMAFDWFASRGVDLAVIETGLGGRLDSTNIITPILSVITGIGLDHCDMLGDSLGEIAFEKAGIIKAEIPVVVGSKNPETEPVFERKVLYSNLSQPKFMGDRKEIMSLLTYAEDIDLPDFANGLLEEMDLHGAYQKMNLRTVLACLKVLGWKESDCGGGFRNALAHTAFRTGFRGRWEQLSASPWVICDIGHNADGLKYNFSQLDKMRKEGRLTSLIMVFGCVADKDARAVLSLLPEMEYLIFTNAEGRRAMPADKLRDLYVESMQNRCNEAFVEPLVIPKVADAVTEAMRLAGYLTEKAGGRNASQSRPLIYVGGSTFVVSEAVAMEIFSK